jgi:hypothetical protein
MRICLIFIFYLTVNLVVAQNIPTAPNKRNDEGKRIGEWVITYDKGWNETALLDSIINLTLLNS